ncbi:Long-chain-fatty-acid--CoA ligase, putative [Hondaea fermentalgiana]|uniref:Long-chain-fatty-acid--CoA ligase, putative n=1 Tax=Hondaea fermentalgiana TaxID=2315210 RepID=A0A2R5GGL8_9STRA|nr:Long-chain-fatty-acid--CoA ligase, putative [Hondaea fermentalgiana]|eukprot:GBG30027.1 Long-chain-fatty-acid--CoA ligase, putative [Hondaea fermentalgiana]
MATTKAVTNMAVASVGTGSVVLVFAVTLRVVGALGKVPGDAAWVWALMAWVAAMVVPLLAYDGFSQHREVSDADIVVSLALATLMGVATWFATLGDELVLPGEAWLKTQLSKQTVLQSVAVDSDARTETTTFPRRHKGFEGELMQTHPDCGPKCRTARAVLDRAQMLFARNKLCATRTVNPDGTYGPYVSRTYGEFLGDMRLCAQKLGHGKRRLERIGLFAKNCEEYAVAMLGALHAGVVVVPLYATLGSQAIRHIVRHAELSTVCVSEENLELVLRLKSTASAEPTNEATRCECLERVYVFKDRTIPETSPKHVNRGPRHFLGVDILPFEVLLREEDEAEDDNGEELKGTESTDGYTERHVDENDLSFILYTSGTTGDPKGVMLTQGGIIACASALCTTVVVREDDVHLSYLPLAHAFEIAVILAGIIRGASVGWYHGNVKELIEDAAALRPTLFIGVPRVFQRVQQVVQQQLQLKPLPIRRLCFHALRQQMRSTRKGHRLYLWDALVFRQVKAALGGRVRLMCSGSAPLAPSVMEFVRVCFDVPLVEGYGLTETHGVCSAMYGGVGGKFDQTVGHVGPPLACSEYKLESVPDLGYTIKDPEGPRGEVLVRGPNIFRGYYKNEELTKEVLVDNWFHTGDIGRFNPNGTLTIIDRKKNMFKLSQGEYVAAEKLEILLQSVPVVGQIFVYGNSYESVLVAIVVPDPQELLPRLRRGAVPEIPVSALPVLSKDLETWLGPYHELCSDAKFGPLINQYVLQEITTACEIEELAKFEYPRAIYIESRLNELLQGFSETNGMLTPTFKTKRNKIYEAYQDKIDGLYTSLKKMR